MTVDLPTNKRKKKEYIPPLVPSEHYACFGGSFNLINSFNFFFLQYSSIWLCNGRWCHIEWNTKKSKHRCYFLSFVVLCIFLDCIVWMKGNFMVIISRHQPPLDSLNRHHRWCRWIFAASIFWRCLHAISLHIHLAVSAACRRYVISCFSGPHK